MSRQSRSLRINATFRTVLWLTVLPFALYALLRLFEYVQVFQPRSDLVYRPQTIHPLAKDVYFKSGDQYRLNAWFFPAAPSSAWKDWVLLISHGNAGNISYRMELYEAWLGEGFNVFAYDYRGYGLSSGRPSESGTYEDVTSAYHWLIGQGFDPYKIIAFGESLGAAVATDLASREPLAALVMQSTFTRIVDIGKELFPWLPVETVSTIRYDTHSKLPEIRVPVFILHSRQDTMIPFRHAEKNFAACPEPKQLLEISGDHNDGISGIQTLYRTHIETIKKALAPHRIPPPETADQSL